jgi:hypothetical protein
METRGRAESRVGTLRAPLLECLEDRRLLSNLSMSPGTDGVDVVQTDQAIIVSASSPAYGMESEQAVTASLSTTAFIANTATSSESGSEGPLSPTSTETSSSSSAATVESPGVPTASEDLSSSSAATVGSQSSAVSSRTEDVSTSSGPAPATYSSVPAAPSVVAPNAGAATQNSVAEEDGFAVSRPAVDEADLSSPSLAQMDDAAIAGSDSNSVENGSGRAAGSGTGKIEESAGIQSGLSGSTQGNAPGRASQAQSPNPVNVLEGSLVGDSTARSGSQAAPAEPSDPAQPATTQGLADGSRSGDDAAVPRPVDARSDVASLSPDSAPAETAIDAPRPADLLTNFLPYDRASVETAVDAFLDQFEGLGAGLTGFVNLGQVVPGIVALGAVTAFSTVMLKRRRNRSEREKSNPQAQAVLDLLTSPSNLWKLGEI